MKAIIKFVQEAKTELAKVSWPSRKTVINLTLTVIGVSLLFAVMIGIIDYAFTEGIKFLTSLGDGSSAQITAPPVDIDLSDIEVNAEGGEVIIE